MNASACDLKSAYIHFTRAAVILEEIIPKDKSFGDYDKQYPFIQDVYSSYNIN